MSCEINSGMKSKMNSKIDRMMKMCRALCRDKSDCLNKARDGDYCTIHYQKMVLNTGGRLNEQENTGKIDEGFC